MTRDHGRRELLLLAPLLVFYIAVVRIGAPSTFEGDEGRYVQFARNLAHGYYVPPGTLHFPSGPGYSLVLAPFAWLGVPWDMARVLNAILLAAGILYLQAALRIYLPRRQATWTACLLGLYPPVLRCLPYLLSETLAIFLVCGLIYHFLALRGNGSAHRRPHLAASGLYLGSLALTKVFFGYVVLLSFLIAGAVALLRRGHVAKRAFLTCALALTVCAPYLAYTYRLTGKVFYWSTIGGASLYWMSTPFPGELGDWQGNSLPQVEANSRAGLSNDLLRNHGAFFRSLAGLDEVQFDDALRQRGVRNSRSHPRKFLINWAANVGRLLFSYPNSFTPQKLSTYFYFVPNMLLVGLALLSACTARLARWRIPGELLAVLVFAALSFFGSSLLSAYPRHFAPLFPAFAVGIVVTLGGAVRPGRLGEGSLWTGQARSG